jgi:hypothetical protein
VWLGAIVDDPDGMLSRGQGLGECEFIVVSVNVRSPSGIVRFSLDVVTVNAFTMPFIMCGLPLLSGMTQITA